MHEIDVQKRQTVQTEATATTNSSTQELGGLPINSIFQKLRNVNTFEKKFAISSKKYALSVVDSDGRTLSAARQDYFKDSVVRDKNGRLLTVYHGRKIIEGLNVFDMSERQGYGRRQVGAYFTNLKSYAESYPNGTGNPTIKAYLLIKNPYYAKD